MRVLLSSNHYTGVGRPGALESLDILMIWYCVSINGFFLNRKLLYAVLFKNLKTHLLLMFLFKNVLCGLALSLKACIIANGITVHLFIFCFSTPFLLLWSKNHQRLAQQSLGVLWLFRWRRWILFFKQRVKKSILQFLFCYWTHYLRLYLYVVSLQEFMCHHFSH